MLGNGRVHTEPCQFGSIKTSVRTDDRQVIGERTVPTRSVERALPKELHRRELDRRVLAKSSRADASRYRRTDALSGDGPTEDRTDAALTHRRIELLVISLSGLPTV